MAHIEGLVVMRFRQLLTFVFMMCGVLSGNAYIIPIFLEDTSGRKLLG